MPTIDWKRTLISMSIFFLLLLGSVWYFRPTGPESIAPAATDSVVQERLQFEGISSGWHLEREQQQGAKLHRQYLPDGQTPEVWSESITVDTFGGLQEQGGPEEFAAIMEKNIREWGGDKVSWNTIRKSPGDLIYEWQVNQREGTPDQHSLGRIIRGKEGLHLIVYTARTATLRPEQRAEMLQCLTTAVLVAPED